MKTKKYLIRILAGILVSASLFSSGTFSREVNGTVINYPASDAHSPYSAETKSFYTAKELAVSPMAYDMSSDHSSGTGRYYNWKQYR